MYKIADLQIGGRYFADGEEFKSKEAVRQQLISYHSNDVKPKDLKILKKMTLHEVLEYGGWDIEKVKGRLIKKEIFIMKKYKVYWEESRFAIVEAKDEDEAIELVKEGQYDKDYSGEITSEPQEAIEVTN